MDRWCLLSRPPEPHHPSLPHPTPPHHTPPTLSTPASPVPRTSTQCPVSPATSPPPPPYLQPSLIYFQPSLIAPDFHSLSPPPRLQLWWLILSVGKCLGGWLQLQLTNKDIMQPWKFQLQCSLFTRSKRVQMLLSNSLAVLIKNLRHFYRVVLLKQKAAFCQIFVYTYH